MRALEPLRLRLVREIETAGGRHDEVAVYGGEAGDPGLAGGPESLSWEIHGDLATLATAGAAAVLMEVAHPSVMAGVFTQSSYRTATLRRARNTLGYVLRTTFGNTRAATHVIERVRRIHEGVTGTRTDGVPYRALDPMLIAWVHTCIPWAVMTAYDRYRRPLSRSEKDRYLREQAPIGRMAGADRVPESVDELEAFIAEMRPVLDAGEQFRSFLDFVAGRATDVELPRLERLDRWVGVHTSMALMPAWAREVTRTEVAAPLCFALPPALRMRAALVRWAFPELPCKRLALARCQALAA